MRRFKWLLTVRDLSSQLEAFLTYLLSDGKQAKATAKEIGVKIEGVSDKVQCVDDKVQVVIVGARGLPVDCQALLTSILSDGEQARVAAKEIGDKVTCVDEKVQVVIDGVRGLSIQWLNPSNICTFRRQTGKSSGARSKFGYSTSSQ